MVSMSSLVTAEQYKAALTLEVSGAVGLLVHFSAEHAVNEDEVSHSQGHTKGPEDQANAKRIGSGMRVVNGDVERGISG